MAKAKQIHNLDCAAPAVENIRLILALRFEEMLSFREAALDWRDPDGVHDMRVASRRLRGTLSDFRPYLRKRAMEPIQEEIKELARALGQVRDYDVSLAELGKIASKAPAELAAGLRQISQLRQAERDQARAKLTTALDAEALSQLKLEFLKSLDSATSPIRPGRSRKSPVVGTCVSYQEIGRAVIVSRLEEFEKLAEAFQRPLKVKPLHRLRIGAKHLRYALELFAPCWNGSATTANGNDAPRLKEIAKKLAELQSSLGSLHDCDVWINSLSKTADNDSHDREFDQPTSVWLIGYFIKLRGKHLSEALVQWNAWKAEHLSLRIREAISTETVLEAESADEKRSTVRTQLPSKP